jgi:colicin import membrane protein
MRFTDISVFQREGKQKAYASSITLLVLVLLCLLIKLPFDEKTEAEKLEEELGGVTVALGYPDLGSNQSTPSDGGGEPPSQSEPAAPSDPTPPTPAPSNPPAAVVTGEDPEVKYAREKAREDEKKRLKDADDQLQKAKQETAARESVRKAEEAKQAAAEATEAKRLADIKSKIGSGFGKKPGSQGGTGEGSGNSGKSGNGGRPDGSPNSDKLEGEGSGNGTGRSIGGGLGSRTFKGASPMSTKYNTNGTVVVKVSVDDDGKVTSAVVTNQGTNTSDPTLRSLAVQNAQTYRFAPGDAAVGTITYTFKVK